MNQSFIHLFHIIFVGGLFLYIGIKQKTMSTTMYNVILATGVLILFYHFYKGYKKIMIGKNAWVNIFHVLIVAPLLILTGIKKQNTPRYIYEFIFMLAFASIGYHGYYMVF